MQGPCTRGYSVPCCKACIEAATHRHWAPERLLFDNAIPANALECSYLYGPCWDMAREAAVPRLRNRFNGVVQLL
jgi:hypothetical protein